MSRITVGVLGLQGDVAENVSSIRQALDDAGRAGNVIPVKTSQDVVRIDGLVIPGGESTTIGRMSMLGGMLESVRDRILSGVPVFGICAGMVLLSKNTRDLVVGETNQALLGILDVDVERNSFGRQRQSFERQVDMTTAGIPSFTGVFIRAPSVVRAGPTVAILAELDGRTVAVKQENMLATAFHPELTADVALHRYFVDMIPAA